MSSKDCRSHKEKRRENTAIAKAEKAANKKEKEFDVDVLYHKKKNIIAEKGNPINELNPETLYNNDLRRSSMRRLSTTPFIGGALEASEMSALRDHRMSMKLVAESSNADVDVGEDAEFAAPGRVGDEEVLMPAMEGDNASLADRFKSMESTYRRMSQCR
jgi:hypothetical protein